jgi:hypothetical protein
MEQSEKAKPDLSALRIHRDDDEGSGARRGLRVVLLGTVLILVAAALLVGYRMWGAATHDRSTGVHRPLTATAVVFQALEEPMSCEREQVVEGLRPLLDLPVEHMLATHGVPFERADLELALSL